VSGVEFQWEYLPPGDFPRPASRSEQARSYSAEKGHLMSKQVIEVVLPRLAKTLYRELRRYRAGKLDEAAFSRCFEDLLQRQHTWLISRGVSDVVAALAIHSAVLILSGPGLRAEAADSNLPLEIIEYRAIREAAADVAHNYGIKESKAYQVIGKIVARYGT
jgi:hypothetical protein